MAEHRSTTGQDFWDKIWRDKDDKIVIWQTPSLLLIGWAVLTIASIFTSKTLGNVLWYVSLAVLAAWSLLEIFKGANYFRRAFGVVVLLLIVAALFKLGY